MASVNEAVYDDGSAGYANHHGLYIKFLGVSTGHEVRFKGFIVDHKDSFESKWNEEQVYGRNDPITTFQSIKRSLSFKLEVPSGSHIEARKNFKSLSRLIALLYPGYSSGAGANVISTAPLFKVKFSNWVGEGKGGGVKSSGLLGAMRGFSFSPDLNAGVWDAAGSTLPKTFTVTCDMTVLHTESLGWRGSGWRGWRSFPYGVGTLQKPEPLPPAPAAAPEQVEGAVTDDLLGNPLEGGEFGDWTQIGWLPGSTAGTPENPVADLPVPEGAPTMMPSPDEMPDW